ncbi:hypothetical protein ONZ45_g9629 [Pleurotus djamor]|nr:hypothetical protein ONZ45_g9629 [Pleurotus djamor]
MSLYSSSFAAVNLFKHLQLPITATFDAVFSNPIINDESVEVEVDLSGLESTFLRFRPNFSHSRLERISIAMLPYFEISVYPPEDELWLQNFNHHGLALFHFSTPKLVPIPITSYSPLCDALPLSSTRVLALKGVRGEALISMASSIMHASIHIKTLEIEECDVGLLESLFKLPGEELPINPELECLVFEGPLYDEENEDQGLLPVLIRLLYERQDLGIPIKTLKGWFCGDVPARMMKKLKRLVEVVN